MIARLRVQDWLTQFTAVRVLLCWWDRLVGNTYERCPGCGAWDEELAGPCVGYGFSHHPVSVDRFGDSL